MRTDSGEFFDTVFLAKRATESDQAFEPHRCALGYLRQRIDRCGIPLPELASFCGYRDLEKFRRHVDRWRTGSKPVPLKLLAGIGCDPEMLGKMARLDQDRYWEALSAAPPPRRFVVRIMPAIYRWQLLPPGLSGDAVIAFVAAVAAREGRPCMIDYDGLKQTFVEPGGGTVTRYLWPTLRYGDGLLRFARLPDRTWTTRLCR